MSLSNYRQKTCPKSIMRAELSCAPLLHVCCITYYSWGETQGGGLFIGNLNDVRGSL